jgi:hypothetical protein
METLDLVRVFMGFFPVEGAENRKRTTRLRAWAFGGIADP